jgi:hypothetical protein
MTFNERQNQLAQRLKQAALSSTTPTAAELLAMQDELQQICLAYEEQGANAPKKVKDRIANLQAILGIRL